MFDIIDLHQTVNGQNKFMVRSLIPLVLVYWEDRKRVYEYNAFELLLPDKYDSISSFEIVGNIREVANY